MKTVLTFTLLIACALTLWTNHLARLEARLEAAKLIQMSPKPMGWDHDPSKLIRAINKLHHLGESESISVLKQFIKENPNNGDDESPHHSVQFIVEHLYEKRNSSDGFPQLYFDKDNALGYKLSNESWSSWVQIEGGIPFHIVYLSGSSGSATDCDYMVDWAENHGRLRDSPLVPDENPFIALENLIEQHPRGQLEDTKIHLRMQVYRMIAHLLPTKDGVSSVAPFRDEEWAQYQNSAQKLGIFWDRDIQAYSAKTPSPD